MKIKKIIALVLSMVMMLGCLVIVPVHAVGTEDTPVLSVSNVAAAVPGDTVTLKVSLADTQGNTVTTRAGSIELSVSSADATVSDFSWNLPDFPLLTEYEPEKMQGSYTYRENQELQGDVAIVKVALAETAATGNITVTATMKLQNANKAESEVSAAGTITVVVADPNAAVARPEDVITVGGNKYVPALEKAPLYTVPTDHSAPQVVYGDAVHNTDTWFTFSSVNYASYSTVEKGRPSIIEVDDLTYVSFVGWVCVSEGDGDGCTLVGANPPLLRVGYQIDNGDIVWLSASIADPDVNGTGEISTLFESDGKYSDNTSIVAGHGNPNTIRYHIVVPVSQLTPGDHSLYLYANGDGVYGDENDPQFINQTYNLNTTWAENPSTAIRLTKSMSGEKTYDYVDADGQQYKVGTDNLSLLDMNGNDTGKIVLKDGSGNAMTYVPVVDEIKPAVVTASTPKNTTANPQNSSDRIYWADVALTISKNYDSTAELTANNYLINTLSGQIKDNDAYYIGFIGWMNPTGDNDPLSKVGYQIDDNEIVWCISAGDFESVTYDADLCANPEVASENARRYNIRVNINNIPAGKHHIYLYGQDEGGKVYNVNKDWMGGVNNPITLIKGDAANYGDYVAADGTQYTVDGEGNLTVLGEAEASAVLATTHSGITVAAPLNQYYAATENTKGMYDYKVPAHSTEHETATKSAAANCAAYGKTVKYCTACTDDPLISISYSAKEGHSFTITDCTVPTKCDYCDAMSEAKADHSFTYDPNDCTKVITCGNDGCQQTSQQHTAHAFPATTDCTQSVKCNNCAAMSVAADGHNFVKNPADCTAVVTCQTEGCTATHQFFTSHNYQATQNCMAPSVCANCSQSQQGNASHNFSYDPDDCTKVVTCSNPNCNVTDQKYTTHDLSTGSDCTAAIKCSHCNYQTTPKADHSYIQNAADCTATVRCSNEGCTSTKQFHSKHSFTITDCTASVKCANCTTMSVAKQEHTMPANPNCANGITCTECDHVFKAPGSAHTLGTITNCLVDTYCTYCGQLAVAKHDSHDYGDATCDEEATCANCTTSKTAGEHIFNITDCTESVKCVNCDAYSTKQDAHTFNAPVDDCTATVQCSNPHCTVQGKAHEAHAYDNGYDEQCNNCNHVRFVLGDLDGDDKPTAADAVYLKLYIDGEDGYALPEDMNVDFNGDHVVDVEDANLLLMYYFFDEDYTLNPTVA